MVTPLPARSSAPPRRAFTLVEMLVVISIISVLVALLLPAISMVREMGRRLQCLANERQIGMTQLAYETDYNALPTIAVNSNGQFLKFHLNRTTTSDALYTLFNSYLNGAMVANKGWNVADNTNIYVAEATRRGGPLRCPSANFPNGSLQWAPTNTNGNGGYNAYKIWAGFLTDYAPTGGNTFYWLERNTKGINNVYGDGISGAGTSSVPLSDTPGWCRFRRTERMPRPTLNGLVNEPCFKPTYGASPNTSDYSANDHQAAGLNLCVFDGSGKWVSIANTVAHAQTPNGPAFSGDNFLDTINAALSSGGGCNYPLNTFFGYNYVGTLTANADTNVFTRYYSATTNSDLVQMGYSAPSF